MAKGTQSQVLVASSDVMGTMPREKVTSFVAQLAALGIAVVEVDSHIDAGTQVEDAHRFHGRIVGFLGQSEKDIPGLRSATKLGGLAIALGGPASIWCAREEGRSFPFGKCLEVREPSNAILAIQSAVGGG
ncbi:MAG: hypothetical protein IT342_23350 [Candidatus Melainabacteria bacterium]|nr:hypothetical protein [Candidatus Melainabacteria bacterium]